MNEGVNDDQEIKVEDSFVDEGGDTMMNGDDDSEPIDLALSKAVTPKQPMSSDIVDCVTAELLFIKTCEILTLSTQLVNCLAEGTRQLLGCLNLQKVSLEDVCDVNMEDLTQLQQYCLDKDCKGDATMWSYTKGKCF